MASRREFIEKSAAVVAAIAATGAAKRPSAVDACICANTETISLCGIWKFAVDPGNAGTQESWFAASHSSSGWRDVEVPHTWQIEPAHADYRGVAWYRREFEVHAAWRDAAVRIEFEAVFHSATVWVNGQIVGEHLRKGYTAFTFDIASVLRWEQTNNIVVRVDSAFNEQMLPRGRSSDWAHDGGIFRPVQLLVTPRTFVEHVTVDALPDFATGNAALSISASCRNASTQVVERSRLVSSHRR